MMFTNDFDFIVPVLHLYELTYKRNKFRMHFKLNSYKLLSSHIFTLIEIVLETSPNPFLDYKKKRKYQLTERHVT